MNQNPVVSGSDEVLESTPVYAQTDMTVLVEIIQTAAQENKKGIDELAKLHRNMYNSVIQKQNDELESYRRGALRQSKVDVLRSIADIYLENEQSAEKSHDPIEITKYIISQLKDLLEDNEVEIVQSAHMDIFDRKTMKTKERYVVPTSDSSLERKVVKSIKPGFMFFGEPLLQEEVSVYKFNPELIEAVVHEQESANGDISTECTEASNNHTFAGGTDVGHEFVDECNHDTSSSVLSENISHNEREERSNA